MQTAVLPPSTAQCDASAESEERPKQKRTSNVIWTVATSVLLAAFTTFVLLDAFVIEHVQQTVQQADFSSIVAAQGKDAASDSQTAGDNNSNGSSGDATAGAAATDDSSDDSSGSVSANASQGSAQDSQENSGHRHGHPGGSRNGGASKHSKSGSSSGSSSSKSGSAAVSASTTAVVAGAASAASTGTQIGSYSDDNMTITVSSVRAYDTDIYVADIQVSSAEYLKTALAQNAFGRNLKDTTSNMAQDNGAVLAINGDYYGFRDDGYVVRNGVLYRDTTASDTDALVVYGDGSMASVSQDSTTAQQLVDSGAWQVLSFGPTLVENGKIAISENTEVGQSMSSNPRTAIGMVDPLHYVVVVSDGRTGDNAGLSLYALAQVLVDNGATYAYNLDGGGSTTLYFQGEVLNNPTSGNRSGERNVSDIVYFG